MGKHRSCQCHQNAVREAIYPNYSNHRYIVLMWVPVDEYKGDSSFFAKDKRVQILIAFVAVLGAGLLGVVVFLIVRCATHRKRTAKKVTTQFRIAHAHNAVSQQQMLGMSPMPPGPPVLPGRSPIVVTLPAAAPPTAAPAQQV